MKRVLFITYFFPPIANSATQRAMKLANYLEEFGWSPTVLTIQDPPDTQIDERLLEEVHPRVEVERVPLGSLLLARRLTRFAGPLQTRASSALEWRLRRLERFPDLYGSWLRPAIARSLELASKRQFDAVLATGFPWTDLLIGRGVGTSLGVPWVIDFQDPWTGDQVFDDSGDHTRHRRRAIRLEQELLRSASCVSVVTDALGDHLRALAQEGCAPVVTLPNGYDGDEVTKAAQPSSPHAGKVRVVYAGVWRDAYNPGILYDAVERLKQRDPTLASRFEVVTAGYPAGEAQRRGIDDLVHEHGYLTHTRALALMHSASALFLSLAGGVHQRVQIPGKLYEYLAVGKPVIAMADADGSTARLLARVDGGVVRDPHDVSALVDVLDQLSRTCGNELPRASRDAVADFEWRAISQRLAGVLDRVVATT